MQSYKQATVAGKELTVYIFGKLLSFFIIHFFQKSIRLSNRFGSRSGPTSVCPDPGCTGLHIFYRLQPLTWWVVPGSYEGFSMITRC